MTLRSAVWTGVTLTAIGIGGILFTGVAGAAGLRVPWTQSRVAQAYGGMMGAGGNGADFAGMMGGPGGGYRGMMGQDPAGTMMGAAMANGGSQTVSPAEAQSLGDSVPAGATVDRAQNQLVFHTTDVQLAVLGSPQGGPDMTFRIAAIADPTIVVPKGAKVTVQFVNADADTAHGWLLTAAQRSFPYMGMMAGPPAFPGAFAVPLGDPTAAGMPTETITFTAGQSGKYTYLCPVPGHAQQGMHGVFEVTA